MKKIDNVVVDTYEDEDGFMVDIVTKADEDKYEAWIWHKDYGIKSYMFSMMMSSLSYDEFLALVESNTDEWAHGYAEDYMD